MSTHQTIMTPKAAGEDGAYVHAVYDAGEKRVRRAACPGNEQQEQRGQQATRYLQLTWGGHCRALLISCTKLG